MLCYAANLFVLRPPGPTATQNEARTQDAPDR